MLSLQPPQSKWPLLSLVEPFFLGSQEQDFSSPWLHALVMAKTTPAEEMACTKADSRLPETKKCCFKYNFGGYFEWLSYSQDT